MIENNLKNDLIPPMIEYLKNSMLDQRTSVYNRLSFRDRLVALRENIDTAIKKFDGEYAFAQRNNVKKNQNKNGKQIHGDV